MKHHTYYIIALLTLFTACGNTDYEYSGYPCYFIFNNSASQSPALASATNPNSPGIFCRVTMPNANYFNFNTNQGLSDKVALTALDKQRTNKLGVYNGTGIIIGYGNLNNPAILYAYDSQCPNCFKDTSMPRYQLTMKTNGTAECGSCHRKYDMNNDGLIIDGDQGDKLIRYHASIAGGIVSVIN